MIKNITFLKYKDELTEYGYQIGKISMKEQTVIFHKIVREGAGDPECLE